MQYYIKIFNRETDQFIGYYKETGKNCISTMLNGIKYFDDLDSALKTAREHDGGFLRDKDKQYYTAMCVVYGDSTRQPRDNKNNSEFSEEEKEDAINSIIRKSSDFNER